MYQKKDNLSSIIGQIKQLLLMIESKTGRTLVLEIDIDLINKDTPDLIEILWDIHQTLLQEFGAINNPENENENEELEILENEIILFEDMMNEHDDSNHSEQHSLKPRFS